MYNYFGNGSVMIYSPLESASAEPMSAERPFTGEHDVTVEDISLGDIVKFKTEADPRNGVTACETFGVVLEIRERTLDYLRVPIKGSVYKQEPVLDTVYLADNGLKPYELPDGSLRWNRLSHTITSGVNVSPTLLSHERAESIRGIFLRLGDMQERYGVRPSRPSIAEVALETFVMHALWGAEKSPFYQSDLER